MEYLVIKSSYIYTYKKREVRLFFTLLKGFAIPVHSRKNNRSPRPIYTTLPPCEGRERIIHTHGTFIVAAATVYKLCEGSEKSQTTSINAFYVTAFLRCRCQRYYLLFNSFCISSTVGIFLLADEQPY